jgi:CheY-like chemotaxis protein/HPt (histidine-containing phosphotransfer) domain-containing protein
MEPGVPRIMALGKSNPTENYEVPPLKILVVDDDELNRRMMKILLTREGHHVDLAANGMEALDAVKYQKFDIVFMDLQMPSIDGIESSRRIREWENGGLHTFIVALTASYMPEQGQRLFEAGIDNYISKPFELEYIQRMLRLISKKTQPILVPPEPVKLDEKADPCVLDIEKGIRRVGGELETYVELLGDFVGELPKRMNTIERYLLERNMDSLSREAHNLKGVSSNLGAMELAGSASTLDKQSNEGYTHLIEGMFLELKKAESHLLRTATDFLARH